MLPTWAHACAEIGAPGLPWLVAQIRSRRERLCLCQPLERALCLSLFGRVDGVSGARPPWAGDWARRCTSTLFARLQELGCHARHRRHRTCPTRPVSRCTRNSACERLRTSPRSDSSSAAGSMWATGSGCSRVRHRAAHELWAAAAVLRAASSWPRPARACAATAGRVARRPPGRRPAA